MTGTTRRAWAPLLACILLVAGDGRPASAQAASGAVRPAQVPTLEPRDGQHDFDFEIGRWTTRLKRRTQPLTSDTTWAAYEGTTVVRKVWNGRANLVELDVAGPAGRIEALSLRLYNPQSRQWSLNFSSSRSGTLSLPTIGEFNGTRGEFYAQESLDGRAILVRFIISPVAPDTCRFEQAFSTDGGRTWEVNWIATDTREPGEAGKRGGHADPGT